MPCLQLTVRASGLGSDEARADCELRPAPSKIRERLHPPSGVALQGQERTTSAAQQLVPSSLPA